MWSPFTFSFPNLLFNVTELALVVFVILMNLRSTVANIKRTFYIQEVYF